MAEHSVVGVYKTLSEAEAAVQSLGDGGFPLNKVSIIATNLKDDRRIHGYATASNFAHRSEDVGTWVGGIFGALIGVAFIWVPGFGPLIIAGSLASMIIGGVEGAMSGAAASGVLGWLVGLGIGREHIRKYEEAVKSGKYLIIAHGAQDSVKRAHEILSGSKAEQLDLHTPATV